MDEREERQRLKSAIDATLSGIQGDPWLAQRVLADAKGDVKVKKKLSMGLVLVLVLVFSAMTALAAALLWKQQVVPMKEIELMEGDYVNWSIGQKQALVRALVDSGNIAESDETVRLFDDSTDEATMHAIADQLLLTLTGQTDVKEISVDIITYAIMGPMDTWTPEQRVWWQQVTEQLYDGQGGTDTLVTPSADIISEAEAVAIAKAAVLAAYELPSDALNNALPVANLYTTEQRPDYRRWDIQFKVLRDGSDNYVERVYVAIVDEHGNVVDDPDVQIYTPQAAAEKPSRLPSGYPDTPLFQPINDLALRAGNQIFQLWPLELKAEYSQNVAPQVRAIVDSGDLSPLNHDTEPNLDVIAFSSYTYGLPGESDLTQEDAFALAKQAVMQNYHLDSETIELYDDSFFYFDITNPDTSLWKIVFWPSYASAEKFPEGFASGQGHLRYKVEIHSQTGVVTKAEEFEFQALGGDLEYKLKLY